MIGPLVSKILQRRKQKISKLLNGARKDCQNLCLILWVWPWQNHYFINKSGQIYEARAIGYKGVHVDANNSYKIGINLLGDYNSEGMTTSSHDELTKKQLLSCIHLINELKKYFPLKCNS